MKHFAMSALVAASSLYSASLALAADAVVDEVVVLDEAFDWSGVYVGSHVGYGWGDASYLSASDDDFDNDDFDGSAAFSPDLDGVLAGVHAGYNWQVNNFVLGIEGDASWSGMDGSTSVTLQSGGYFLDADTDVEWLASLRGRVGIAWDRLLFYGTGGVAFARTETNVVSDFSGSVISDSDSTSHVGWALGAGVEAMVTSNISVRLEYLHYDFSGEDFFVRLDPSSDAYDLFGESDLDIDAVRLGVSFHF
jgi:outer membrane immunogenic protein